MPEKIKMLEGKLQVGNNPTIPFIEGDGTGPDIWRAAIRVIDSSVKIAYNSTKKIEWLEVLAGQKAFDQTGSWLPDETIKKFKEYLIGIKGPLTTPVGGGIRSLNVALRQILDLYVCLRPIHYFQGVPSPVRYPEKVDMVIFRENTEDVYSGKELQAGTPEVKALLDHFKKEYGWTIRPDSGIGIKPISESGSKRIIRAAIEYAIKNNRKSVTLVHKGNIMKFTEGAFRNWGYELAKEEYSESCISWEECKGECPDGKF